MNQSELNAPFGKEMDEDLLRQLHKAERIISAMKHPECPVSVENRALLATYGCEGEAPLGMEHIREVSLAYQERKALYEFLDTKISEQLRPLQAQLKANGTTWLQSPSDSSNGESQEILQQDEERQRLTYELTDLVKQKLQLMQRCAEIRTGSYQLDTIDLLHSKAKLSLLKTKYMKKALQQDMIDCTTHSMKAIREVDAYVNTLLDKVKQ